MLEVAGKLRVDNWKDEDGKNHTKTYVVADSVKILTSRKKPEFENEEKSSEDNLPF